MISDTERLDFLIENQLRIEQYHRNKDKKDSIYQVIDDLDADVVGEAADPRIAIDQAMSDKYLFT